MTAIFWWAVPNSFGIWMAESAGQTFKSKLFNQLKFNNNAKAHKFLGHYVDATGSQQYWDFFAPRSPKYHQYVSVCNSIAPYPELGKIACNDKPLFSNLDAGVDNSDDVFKPFGSDRSRLYRLTENLANLDDPELLKAFAQYYRISQHDGLNGKPVYLVLHQFELHPELDDLVSVGYRMDKVLLALP